MLLCSVCEWQRASCLDSKFVCSCTNGRGSGCPAICCTLTVDLSCCILPPCSYTDIKRKEGQSVFIRPHEGLFGLREWVEQGVAFQVGAGQACLTRVLLLCWLPHTTWSPA